ncbi:MAG TPA: hypothetical protein VFE15_12770 [Marmoricola sp.]|jgi:hypothetical protein|nr:hypothetical protein [Marmoricola sp.]
MEWIRNRPKVAAACGTLAVIVVLALAFTLAGGHGKAAQPSAFGTAGPPLPSYSSSPLAELPAPSAKATPTTKAQTEKAIQSTITKLKNSSGLGSTSLGSGSLNVAGLQGGSVYKYLPKHQVVMRVVSDAPIGTVGYVVPTSLNNSSGIVKNVANSWSLTTTAYGNPDYAQIYLQAGSRGFPITCTITVDGKITEQRSTQGPYGELICQG